MDEQNQTAAPAEITVEQAAKARRAEEQLAAYTKQQEEQQAAADAFLAKASAMLGHQVTSFFMVAVGPAPDGSLGVDRIGSIGPSCLRPIYSMLRCRHPMPASRW
jgi:hypothetical protein